MHINVTSRHRYWSGVGLPGVGMAGGAGQAWKKETFKTLDNKRKEKEMTCILINTTFIVCIHFGGTTCIYEQIFSIMLE